MRRTSSSKHRCVFLLVVPLLLFALPSGSVVADPQIPEGTPKAVAGKVEGYIIRTISGAAGLGTDDPSTTYAEGDLQILPPPAIPFQIKGIAATVNPGFLGGAVLFGQVDPEMVPGYAESFDT